MSGLLILGAGGHGKVVAEIAALTGKLGKIAFLDDNSNLKNVNGIPVVGRLDDFDRLKDDYGYAFVAIGNNRKRLGFIDRISKAGFQIPVLTHPFTSISGNCSIGPGTAVMAGAVINTNVTIGKGCIVNTSSSVDHDCVIEDGVHISPGAHIGGTSRIGRNSWICIGASISNNINIGSESKVAAGAAVITDVEANTLVGGVPAVVKKRIGVAK